MQTMLRLPKYSQAAEFDFGFVFLLQVLSFIVLHVSIFMENLFRSTTSCFSIAIIPMWRLKP